MRSGPSIFSLLENPVLTVFSRADHAASLESQLKMMTRGVYLLLAFLFVFSMVKSGQHPDDQSAGKAAGAWDFAVCGNDRKAGFPYADRRMPVVRRGYGIFVGWHWRNPGLDF